jgi:uncharacterized protein (TIGR02270 family)
MVTSLRQFRVDLYEEHLDEASFLWEQCQAVRAQPELPWTSVGAFEERLEAHLDALMVGGDLALDVCRRRAAAGEPGELYAAASIFCRYADPSMFAATLRTVDLEQAERAHALGDALKLELPDAWREHCVRAVETSRAPLLTVLATVIGFRRLPQSDTIVDLVPRAPEAQQERLLWALGRTRPRRAIRAIRPLLRSTDAMVRRAAIYAGLRVHDPESRTAVLALGGAEALPLLVGLCGDRSAVAGLTAASRIPDAPAPVVAALGLLGDPSAVRRLVELLSVPALARPAAEALHVITGAPLLADVKIRDEMTDDEMFDDELEEFRTTGVRPIRRDGQPYGTTVRQLSTDASVWQAWLQANGSRFKADRRYRVGREYSPQVLFECLAAETFPKSYRAWIADELLVRYGIDVPLEPDLPVDVQRRVIGARAHDLHAGEPLFEPGRWYCFGTL